MNIKFKNIILTLLNTAFLFILSANFAFADCGWWYTKSSFTTQDCSYNSGKTVNSDASFCQNSPKPTMYEKRPNDFICCCSKEEKEVPVATVANEGIKKPILQIPIPTITFSDKICSGGDDGGICRIGWIGEYITGIYKYAVIIIGIVAVIVMMLGGVIWLMSAGNSSQIGEAKKWIGASLSGLVITLCSYLILYQINPNLTILKPLEIMTIKKINIPMDLVNMSNSRSGGNANEYKNMDCANLKQGDSADFYITSYCKPLPTDYKSKDSFLCAVALNCWCPNNDSRDNSKTCTGSVSPWHPCNDFGSQNYCNSNSSGQKPTVGTIAADNKCFKSGDMVTIDGKDFTVADTGGAIKGRRIDIWSDSCKSLYGNGTKNVIIKSKR